MFKRLNKLLGGIGDAIDADMREIAESMLEGMSPEEETTTTYEERHGRMVVTVTKTVRTYAIPAEEKEKSE
ncbi:MAG TPA: hypothetical protein VFR23_24485 [Jiangellaceae bacterium]|nr:hypothetical protein [Jiangellaceae bacterium]